MRCGRASGSTTARLVRYMRIIKEVGFRSTRFAVALTCAAHLCHVVEGFGPAVIPLGPKTRRGCLFAGNKKFKIVISGGNNHILCLWYCDFRDRSKGKMRK
jgi:hypothetical protein